eukprot:TRINITY_DN57030_c0_g1_i1.p1 TRINITY_DN57030_c0_g1~~TRINITY_DN57030_c0_g1_i1.p1  ORF type:complete len:323 (-),score=39.25 TRINITY_DN57030_c0_g1_i1:73-1041(-)
MIEAESNNQKSEMCGRRSSKRPAWADLADTSNESLPAPAPPPLIDSQASYDVDMSRESLDGGSHGDLTTLLDEVVSLEGAGACGKRSGNEPLRRVRRRASAGECEKTPAGDASTGTTIATEVTCHEWRPNIDAPVFVPMCETSDQAQREGWTAPTALPSCPSVSMTEARSCSMRNRQMDLGKMTPGRKGAASASRARSRKLDTASRFGSIGSGAFGPPPSWRKRCRSMVRRTSDGISAKDSPSNGDPVKDWQRRQEKRRSAVLTIRSSDEYRSLASARARGVVSMTAVPRTPDPDDATVSKRSWEAAVMRWRIGIKQWAANP